jgi:hypothetical protein
LREWADHFQFDLILELVEQFSVLRLNL